MTIRIPFDVRSHDVILVPLDLLIRGAELEGIDEDAKYDF
jgi:hypothetical protein